MQKREEKLAVSQEEKMDLACRLSTVIEVVSDKEEYYKDLLLKWKEGVDKTI